MAEIIEFRGRPQTGPRTAAGKRRSSLNALKAGIYSKAVIIRGVEEPDEFEALFKSVIAFHDIEDPIALLAAERLVSTAWRLRRVRRVEAEKLSALAKKYVASEARVKACRDQIEQIAAWRDALSAVVASGFIAAKDVADAAEAAQYVFDTADLAGQGIPDRVVFDSDRIGRISDAGRRVRARTARAALDEARRSIPEPLAGFDFRDFVWTVYQALVSREKDARADLERAEAAAARAFVFSMELDADDQRSVSDAERRLDMQFTRALSDFFAARRAAQPALPWPTGAREKIG